MTLKDFLQRFDGFDPETELFMSHWLHGDKLDKISDIEVKDVLVSKDADSELFVISENVTENTVNGILIQ